MQESLIMPIVISLKTFGAGLKANSRVLTDKPYIWIALFC